MGLTECKSTVDSQGRELVIHGTTDFPIACYHDDFSRESLPWHWHEELELAILTEGQAVLAIGNEKFIMQVGDGIFINSGVLHAAWVLDHTSCRFHSIVFHHRLVSGSHESVFFQKYLLPLLHNRAIPYLRLSANIPWQCSCLEAMERAWHTCVQESAGFEFAVREELSRLIFLLHSNVSSPGMTPRPKPLPDESRIKTMLSYIHGHYSEELTAAQIAASANISESECLRCFHAFIGTTPIRYLNRYRIQQASSLLLTTGEKISAIAHDCGFQDMSYFSKIFREVSGMSPTQYRKKASL